MKNNKVATTVKVENALYDDFKVLGVRHKLTLQGLVERCVYRYVNEDNFRDGINNFFLPVVSETSASLAS
jgi:predicted DNA-binding ribbon-helix-helix protein